MFGVDEPPALYRQIKDKQMMFLGVLFMINNLGNSMLATGAFEVYADGVLVFSKLQEGRAPSEQDIHNIIELLTQQ